MKTKIRYRLIEILASVCWTVKKHWSMVLAVLFAIFIWYLTIWVDFSWPNCVVHNPNGAMIATPEIKKAMLKMGPHYSYRLFPNGRLEVNRGDGKWLKLRY